MQHSHNHTQQLPAPTTCKQAIKNWEEKNGESPAEAREVSLIGQIPPLQKLDESINQFENCTKLSLSTNAIERMISMPKLKQIRILSLGRNNIRRFQFLDELAGSLEELWISYNQIQSLEGIQACTKLHTFYISNNKISNWSELEKVATLEKIINVVFTGNPIYGDESNRQNWPKVCKMIPQIENIDGNIVTEEVKREARDV